MAITYLDIGSSVNDVNFQNRVVGALNAQCVVVNNEAGSTPNHALRLTLMGRVIANPEGYAKKFSPLICVISPISSLVNYGVAADAQILTAVAAVWDAFAVQSI
jgi:hypothetical protein